MSTNPYRRTEHRSQIRRLARAAAKAESAYAAAIVRRDQAMLAAHGKKRDGYLSYDEIATATEYAAGQGISKGRVIQIINRLRTGANPTTTANEESA